MEITKMILEFLAEHPVKSFFFLLAFRLVSSSNYKSKE
jgi:hypothetical protein